jgi:hypothetical protein
VVDHWCWGWCYADKKALSYGLASSLPNILLGQIHREEGFHT